MNTVSFRVDLQGFEQIGWNEFDFLCTVSVVPEPPDDPRQAALARYVPIGTRRLRWALADGVDPVEAVRATPLLAVATIVRGFQNADATQN